ncbi:unnamed protein product, partial [Medioppia subpectinata]
NTFRLILCLSLPDGHHYLVHLGDFTQWFGGRRAYFLVPFIVININASYQSLIYLISNEKDFLWIKIFASLRGLIPPSQMGIWKRKILEEVNELFVKSASRISYKKKKWRSDVTDICVRSADSDNSSTAIQ